MDDAGIPRLSGTYVEDVSAPADDEVDPPQLAGANETKWRHHRQGPRPLDRAGLSHDPLDPRRPAHAASRANLADRRIGQATDDGVSHTIIEAGGQPPDLRSFAQQLVSIAEQLRAAHYTAIGPRQPDFMTSSFAIDPHGTTPDAQQVDAAAHANAPDGKSLNNRRELFADMARAAYAKRRKRATIFGDPDLFGEPAWDILLDLFIAEADGKPVSVSSACIGSASPPTTGLRWLGVLAEQGLVDRQHDPQDQRRVLVRLTDKAITGMETYFATSLALDPAR